MSIMNKHETRGEVAGLFLTIMTSSIFFGTGALILAGFPRLETFELYTMFLIMFLCFIGFLYGILLLNRSKFF
jgi:hypothetical protein